jgi:solute carrier family 25 phosphate transporter 23/24/25/41
MLNRIMFAFRQLAKQLNRKLTRKTTLPALKQVEQEAKDANDNRRYNDDDDDYVLTEQDRKEIERLFREIDTNGDGTLNRDELTQALRKGRLPTSQEHMEQLFQEIDSKQLGSIDLDEFTEFVRIRTQRLHRAYAWIMEHADNNNNNNTSSDQSQGFTGSTFRVAAKKSGVKLSDSDCQKIMKQLDQNGNNSISYAEFVNFMLLAPEINPKVFLDSWYTDAFTDDAESGFTAPREIRMDHDEEEEATCSFSQVVAKKLGCGGAAGCVSRTFTAPFDRIRILMMTSVERMGVKRALTTATTGGVLRLWKGNGVNCLKITPEMAIKLLAFDMCKNQIARDPTNVSIGERFVAGGMAGVLSQVSIYPLEVVKTRLAIAGPGEVSGMVGCARQTFARGGYTAFYAGVFPSIVGIIPYAAIDLSLNSWLKDVAAQHLQERKQETSIPILLGSGMISSGTATLLTFPLNVIRTKAQATGEPFGVIFNYVRSQQGWGAFYRGVVPCLAKVLPATSISYASYEYLGGAWDTSVSNSKQ